MDAYEVTLECKNEMQSVFVLPGMPMAALQRQIAEHFRLRTPAVGLCDPVQAHTIYYPLSLLLHAPEFFASHRRGPLTLVLASERGAEEDHGSCARSHRCPDLSAR